MFALNYYLLLFDIKDVLNGSIFLAVLVLFKKEGMVNSFFFYVSETFYSFLISDYFLKLGYYITSYILCFYMIKHTNMIFIALVNINFTP